MTNEHALIMAMLYNNSGQTATLEINSIKLDVKIENLYMEKCVNTHSDYIVVRGKL